MVGHSAFAGADCNKNFCTFYFPNSSCFSLWSGCSIVVGKGSGNSLSGFFIVLGDFFFCSFKNEVDDFRLECFSSVDLSTEMNSPGVLQF